MAATREAAIACQDFVGKGDGKAADGAATNAMRSELASAPGTGRVIIGEGEKDEAPMLFNGESVGDGGPPEFDIAGDPLGRTSLCAAGVAGGPTPIDMAEGGTLRGTGNSLYNAKNPAPAA